MRKESSQVPPRVFRKQKVVEIAPSLPLEYSDPSFKFWYCKYKNVGNPLLNKTQLCVGSQALSSEV
jgi:hypothetical protein